MAYKLFFVLLLLSIFSVKSQTLYNYCQNATPLCPNGDELTAPNVVDIPSTSSIACLGTTPNPTWSIIKIDNPGNIEIEISQSDNDGNGLDVDFALFGPFNNINSACGEIIFEGCSNCSYPFGNVVDCSYSPAPVENFVINNTQSGQVYLLLTTNFSGSEGSTFLNQTNFGQSGSGTLTTDLEVDIISNEVFFNDSDNDPSTPEEAILCGFDSVTIEADSPFADQFIWYKDGLPIQNETSSTLIVTESSDYQVQAFYDQCNSSSFSQVVILKLYQDVGNIGSQSIVDCDESGNGIVDFDLDAFSNSLGLGDDFVVSYYTNNTDANLTTNPLSSPYSSAGETLVVRIEDANAQSDSFLGCRSLSLLELVVDCDDTGFIEVSAFYDDNGNTIFDDNESNFSNGYFTYEINNDGVINNVETSIGRFTIDNTDEANTYDFDFYFYNAYDDCYEASTTSFENVSALFGENISVEFPVTDSQFCQDISVNLVNQQSPRPGFNHINYLIIRNIGINTVTGTLDYILDEDLVLNSISAGSNFSTVITSNGFSLDFIGLEPNESITVTVSLLTPSSVQLGEMVTNTAIYLSASNDLVLDNNESSVTEEVTGSYDPNDKMESHGPEIIYSDFITTDEYLYYTIRFQNVGTAEAIFVRIEDELDSQLDETTFQMLRASHDYTVTRTGTSLEWFFDDINLPAEQDDAEGSNGFVYFKIKPKAGYTVNDVIPNTAAIYFDFNAPIITNTFNSTFIEPLSVNDFNRADINIYPNPANNKVKISLNGKSIDNFEVTLIDIQGKAISLPRAVSNGLLELDVKALNSGLYFVQLRKGDQTFVEKLVIE